MGKLLFILLLMTSNTSKQEFTPLDETSTVKARITDFLPIGWGTIYRCEPLTNPPFLMQDKHFNLYTSVGFSQFQPSNAMNVSDTIQLTLLRTDRFVDTNFSRSPSESGLVDKNYRIWSL